MNPRFLCVLMTPEFGWLAENRPAAGENCEFRGLSADERYRVEVYKLKDSASFGTEYYGSHVFSGTGRVDFYRHEALKDPLSDIVAPATARAGEPFTIGIPVVNPKLDSTRPFLTANVTCILTTTAAIPQIVAQGSAQPQDVYESELFGCPMTVGSAYSGQDLRVGYNVYSRFEVNGKEEWKLVDSWRSPQTTIHIT